MCTVVLIRHQCFRLPIRLLGLQGIPRLLVHCTQTPSPHTAIKETLRLETVTPEDSPSTDQVAEDNTQPRHSPNYLKSGRSPAASPASGRQGSASQCSDSVFEERV
ncbi:hypothetical protein MTO96_046179 [Rhipicephalus appendiculatus]